MRKLLALGRATAAAWVAARRRPREVANIEQRCVAIDAFAGAARRDS